jgi:hypothetical protein
LAFGWVEQNTGVMPSLQPGAVLGCYRVTSAGLRALRRAEVARETDEEISEAA